MEPQPQPVPQPRQGLWQRYRAASLAARIGIAASLILLSCTLCTCVGSGALIILGATLPPLPTAPVSALATAPSTSAVGAYATATPTYSLGTPSPSPTLVPTATPLPATATPKPVPTTPPVISPNAATVGGSVAGFNKFFGSEHQSIYGGSWLYSGPGGDTWVWAYTEEDGSSWNFNSPHRVFEVSTQLADTPQYTTAQANAVVPLFLPTDAKFVANTPPPTGRDGIEKVYFSQMLANTLPASDFKDQNGKAVRPGTIFVLFDGTPNFFFNVELGTDEGSFYF